jgi:hypothetical protein
MWLGHKAQCACYNIIVRWFFYEGYKYGEEDDGIVAWVWGEDFYYEFAELDNAVSSVRYVGFVSDYLQDTVTIFSQEYFKSFELEITEDVPSIIEWDFYADSGVVTGFQPWTLYELVLTISDIIYYVQY